MAEGWSISGRYIFEWKVQQDEKYLISWRNCRVISGLFIKMGEQYEIEVNNTKCRNCNKQQIEAHYFEEGGGIWFIPGIEAALI